MCLLTVCNAAADGLCARLAARAGAAALWCSFLWGRVTARHGMARLEQIPAGFVVHAAWLVLGTFMQKLELGLLPDSANCSEHCCANALRQAHLTWAAGMMASAGATCNAVHAAPWLAILSTFACSQCGCGC